MGKPKKKNHSGDLFYDNKNRGAGKEASFGEKEKFACGPVKVSRGLITRGARHPGPQGCLTQAPKRSLHKGIWISSMESERQGVWCSHETRPTKKTEKEPITQKTSKVPAHGHKMRRELWNEGGGQVGREGKKNGRFDWNEESLFGILRFSSAKMKFSTSGRFTMFLKKPRNRMAGGSVG